jgi:hypothetical protein
VNNLEEFFKQKRLKHEDQIKEVDWEARRERWVADLNYLYEMISTWLHSSAQNGLVKIVYENKIITEENIGTYTVRKMKLWVGTEQVIFDPKGTILIGSYGRVDMIGDEGAIMIVLFEWNQWELAVRTPRMKHWPLTEDSFSDALKQVMRNEYQHVSISYIWKWYQETEKALRAEKKRILDALISHGYIEEVFFGMTREDVDNYFEEHKRELDFLVCFDIISALEACLRLDYLCRVYERLKDPVSRKFRALYRQSGPRVRLSEDILDAWSEEYPSCKSVIGQFRGALHLRDWLAHGRYWAPKKIGRQYTPEDVFDIADQLFESLPAEFEWFEQEN